MKKTLKKFLVTILTAAMVLSSLTITAAADEADSYEIFIAFGADKDAEGDWGWGYAGEEEAAEGITAVTDTIAVGETKTISITLDSETIYTWWLAPVMLAEGVSAMDLDVSVAIDGVATDIDMTAGDAWWYEGTGNYADNAIRLAGGYNEWGAHFIESPKFTTIEYTITLNSIEFGSEAGESVDYDGTFDAFIAFGADKDAEGDWGWGYAGEETAADGITAVTETIAVGETKTVSITLDSETIYTWWIAPVLLADGITELDATVELAIDGVATDIDMTAGDAWWYEGTGDYADNAIRLAGGYNEWGAHYIESPKFTTIEYTITINSAKVGGAAEAEEEAVEAIAFDADGTYNAYIAFQTPKYSFRNAWNDATYGKETEFFNQVTGWEGSDAIVVPGSFNDVVIAGNGTYTVSAEGLEFPAGEFDEQDYMNLIFVSTDMPRDAVEISDVVLKINGSKVELAAAGALISPEDDDQYTTISLQNIWNSDITTLGYYSVPVTSIEVTFTVSGFNYDAAVVEEEVEETTTEEVAEAEETEAAAEEESEEGGLPKWAIPAIIGGVAVVGCGAGVGVSASKKKKASK